jgi:hypothetical protein
MRKADQRLIAWMSYWPNKIVMVTSFSLLVPVKIVTVIWFSFLMPQKQWNGYIITVSWIPQK